MIRVIFRGITPQYEEGKTFIVNGKPQLGKWSVGSLFTRVKKYGEYEYFIISNSDEEEKLPVIEETISVYALKDDNHGNPLFTNDIVQYNLNDEFIVTGIIRFGEYRYDIFSHLQGFYIEVIKVKTISDRDYPVSYAGYATKCPLGEKELTLVGNVFENLNEILSEQDGYAPENAKMDV